MTMLQGRQLQWGRGGGEIGGSSVVLFGFLCLFREIYIYCLHYATEQQQQLGGGGGGVQIPESGEPVELALVGCLPHFLSLSLPLPLTPAPCELAKSTLLMIQLETAI